MFRDPWLCKVMIEGPRRLKKKNYKKYLNRKIKVDKKLTKLGKERR